MFQCVLLRSIYYAGRQVTSAYICSHLPDTSKCWNMLLTIPTIPSQSASVAVATHNFRPLLEKDPGDVGEELQKRGRGSLGSGGKHHLQGLCRIILSLWRQYNSHWTVTFSRRNSETVQSDQPIQTHSDTLLQHVSTIFVISCMALHGTASCRPCRRRRPCRHGVGECKGTALYLALRLNSAQVLLKRCNDAPLTVVPKIQTILMLCLL